MQEVKQREFSSGAIERALLKMILGEKSQYHVADTLSDEKIEEAFSAAYDKVFGGFRHE